MTAPNRLQDRHLEPGRGRVYPTRFHSGWFVDYRAADGTMYGSWASSLAVAHDWIREQATR